LFQTIKSCNRITPVLKVKTDIIISIEASPIGKVIFFFESHRQINFKIRLSLLTISLGKITGKMSKLSIKSKYLPYFVNSLKINYVTFEFFFFIIIDQIY
jgi:hypothetical protein